MVQIVTKCLKCESKKLAYDTITTPFHILKCKKCKKKWKVKPYAGVPKCPECHSENIIYTEDETYCATCGTVLSTSIDHVGGDMINLPWGLLL